MVRPLLRLDAEVLFRAGPEVEILHAGEVYRLRRTRLGKLILTK
nr:hemin uptake protein HemP [Rhodovarius lipocyclicus]